ncbi:MAG: hypothetical protein CM15mP16_12730 [Candidatus Pelagibacterales bacterium]|nr:MAG: hypothetical protein CM15mP16_12730 [Pelagibacterales bacterium]
MEEAMQLYQQITRNSSFTIYQMGRAAMQFFGTILEIFGALKEWQYRPRGQTLNECLATKNIVITIWSSSCLWNLICGLLIKGNLLEP